MSNGKTFNINPSEVFNQNNPSIQNLKLMFPTKFELNKMKTIGGKQIINLEFGKPISWKNATLGGVLPEANSKTLQAQTYGLMIHPATTYLASWLSLFQ